MSDSNCINTHEVTARNKLVQIVQAMLDRQISFFEGARVVCELRGQVGTTPEFDPDFNAFVAIYSETDHLPYAAQRHLWSADALAKLKVEYEKTEQWAATFAPEACQKLLSRFTAA